MDTAAARNRLVAVVHTLAGEKRSELERLKKGASGLDRPDFLWHYLLQSFSTMGGVRGWRGLIENQENYRRVTYDTLAALTPEAREAQVREVCRLAKVNYPYRKAGFIVACFEYVKRLGGPEAAKAKLLALAGREAKIRFLDAFPGIGPKYARNMMMDVYHEDFRDSIALDVRIKATSEALGLSFASYAEHETFYLDVAREAGLNGWELDRLLFNFRPEVESRLGVSVAGPGRIKSSAPNTFAPALLKAFKMTRDLATVTGDEYRAIRAACEALPPPQGNYHRDDYVMNLLLTVLDYQNKRPTIEKAIAHFRAHHGEAIRNHETLREFLNAHPDDREAAKELWGNNHWRRLRELRDLVKFFEGLPEPVTDHNTLRRWAQKSDFDRDFKGKVKGLGLAIYKWLTMRVGINTVKPDVHVHSFLQDAVKRRFSDKEAIAVLENVASEINRKAYELDWSIFEHRTGAVTPISSSGSVTQPVQAPIG